ERRLRPRQVQRLRLRHGPATHHDAQVCDRRHPPVLGQRPAVLAAVLNSTCKPAGESSGLRDDLETVIMPKPGYQWRHVVISTWNSWLPGDPRGFRSKKHKIHSSGDYKNPPPEGDHRFLHDYWKDRVEETVVIPADLREAVGKAILEKLDQLNI